MIKEHFKELEQIAVNHSASPETVIAVFLMVQNIDLTRAVCALADIGVTGRQLVAAAKAIRHN